MTAGEMYTSRSALSGRDTKPPVEVVVADVVVVVVRGGGKQCSHVSPGFGAAIDVTDWLYTSISCKLFVPVITRSHMSEMVLTLIGYTPPSSTSDALG